MSGSILVEEGAGDWVIEGNNIYGINNGIGIGAINVAVFTPASNGKIIGNIIDGGAGITTNPCAFISLTENYLAIEISSNTLFNCPTGNSNSRMIICAATGGSIHDNIINATSATGLSANTTITASSQGILIKDNISYAPVSGRHFLFAAGDFNNVSCQFVGGKFFGGAIGIDTALTSPTNILVWVVNILECTATNVVNMSASTGWGDRQTFFNTYSAKVYPHSIKQRTVMYGNAVPTTGSWEQGDTLYNLAPAGGSPPQGWVCSVGGAPGTWRAMANLI